MHCAIGDRALGNGDKGEKSILRVASGGLVPVWMYWPMDGRHRALKKERERKKGNKRSECMNDLLRNMLLL
jgi:hypothetical protein